MSRYSDPIIMPNDRLDELGELYLDKCFHQDKDVMRGGSRPVPFYQFLADKVMAEQLAIRQARKRLHSCLHK